MKDLLLNYSMSEIVVFIIFIAFAVKELVTFIDWGKGRLDTVYNKSFKSMQSEKKLEKVDETFTKIDQTFEKINRQIDMLIESDKEDIKSYIVREHHYFVYQKGWIDDYSLECIERRFAIYEKEHGNSFVLGLMNELRALPKQPPEPDRDKYVSTAEYVRNAKSSH